MNDGAHADHTFRFEIDRVVWKAANGRSPYGQVSCDAFHRRTSVRHLGDAGERCVDRIKEFHAQACDFGEANGNRSAVSTLREADAEFSPIPGGAESTR
jgi:hypothetical protein